MKYYIATSSLNIDNIMSTECISPVSFYGQRKFGYKEFYKIGQLPYDNFIVLFSELPYFTIHDDQRENHPMVLEIEDDEQMRDVRKVGEVNGCSIFVCHRTLYLTPVSCRMLFFSRQAEVLARQNCSDSKMNKLVDYFKTQTVSEQQYKYKLDDLVRYIPADEEKQQKQSKENDYDRVKGFVCGYYIGSMLSLPPNIARMKAIQKRIYDITVSIRKNGGVRDVNSAFDEELKALSQVYDGLDPDKKEALRLWNGCLAEYGSVEKLNKLFEYLGLESDARWAFINKRGLRVRTKTVSDLGAYNEELKEHINSLIWRNREGKKAVCVMEQLDMSPDYSNVMMDGSDTDSQLFNSILQNILWTGLIPDLEKLRTDRADVAVKVVTRLKETFESKGRMWQGSAEQQYFQHLRENITNFTEFRLDEINDIVLQSLAAFLLKGDDYDGLVGYMETNSVPTYRYALSLWGAVTGYVRIPRTIIHRFMDRVAFETFYVDLYRLLYRRKLNGKLEKQALFTSPMPEVSRPVGVSVSVSAVTEKDSTLSFFGSITEWWRKEGKKTAKPDEKTIVEEVLARADSVLTYESFKKQCQEKGAKFSKGVFRKISRQFSKSGDKQTKPAVPVKQEKKNDGPSFDFGDAGNADMEGSKKYFYNDPNSWELVKDIIPGKDRNRFRNDWDWFLGEMRKPKEQRKPYYQGIDVYNNELVIKKLCDLKKNDKSWFTPELRELVRMCLLEHYVYGQNNPDNRLR